MSTKICKDCRQEKELKRGIWARGDGWRSRCSECWRAYVRRKYPAQSEAFRLYRKRDYAKQREKRLDYKRARREHYKQNLRAWYAKLPAEKRERYKERARRYHAANKERLNAVSRKYHATHRDAVRAHGLMRHYGLTMAQYDAMFAAQGGVCAICRKPPKPGRHLAVDHCHRSGLVRGLLCSRCNAALGNLDDNEERLLAALAYLAATKKAAVA